MLRPLVNGALSLDHVLDVERLQLPPARACLTGGSFRTTPRMAAIARWLARAWLSKIRFCSLPRSIAIITARWVELTGVMTRSGRASSSMRVALQSRTQTPQPRQSRSSRRGLALLGLLRIVRRDQRHRLDRADVDALAAAVAGLLVDHAAGSSWCGPGSAGRSVAPRSSPRSSSRSSCR